MGEARAQEQAEPADNAEWFRQLYANSRPNDTFKEGQHVRIYGTVEIAVNCLAKHTRSSVPIQLGSGWGHLWIADIRVVEQTEKEAIIEVDVAHDVPIKPGENNARFFLNRLTTLTLTYDPEPVGTSLIDRVKIERVSRAYPYLAKCLWKRIGSSLRQYYPHSFMPAPDGLNGELSSVHQDIFAEMPVEQERVYYPQYANSDANALRAPKSRRTEPQKAEAGHPCRRMGEEQDLPARV